MIITLMASTLLAQVDANYQAYIEKYKGLAITEQERRGLPASITLAQA